MFAKSFTRHPVFRVFPGQNGVFYFFFWVIQAKFIFMVPVTFLGSEAMGSATKAVPITVRSGRAKSAEKISENAERGAGNQVPHPSSMKTASAKTLGSWF